MRGRQLLERARKNQIDDDTLDPTPPTREETDQEADVGLSSTEADVEVQRFAQSGGAVEERRGSSAKTDAYDPGPNHEKLSARYGIDFSSKAEAEKVNRLESEFSQDQVQRWADEGMSVQTMGKPRDMETFRNRDSSSSESTAGSADGQSGTLRVSSPSDPAEKEARQVADTVMKQEESTATEASKPETIASNSSSGSFPHASRIQRSLGISLPGNAVLGASEKIQRSTPAVTDGTTTYFADSNPDIEVAAHEAAHQAQHAGLTGDANLGPEPHAGAVAQRVANNQSADDLMNAGGDSVQSAARPYTEAWQGGTRWQLADSGQMAVGSDGSEEALYAVTSLVKESNDVLSSQDSGLRLYEAGESEEFSARGMESTEELERVEPKYPEEQYEHLRSDIEQDRIEGMETREVAPPEDAGKFLIWHDCGHAARAIMGIGSERWSAPIDIDDVRNDAADETLEHWVNREYIGEYAGDAEGIAGGSRVGGFRTTQLTDQLEQLVQNIVAIRNRELNEYYTRETGEDHSGSQGYERYQEASEAEKEQVYDDIGLGETLERRTMLQEMIDLDLDAEKAAGANEHARATVGESYTTNYEDAKFNFHYGAVIMDDGTDHVTLENFFAQDFHEAGVLRNYQWILNMYGPAEKGQTFHDEYKDLDPEHAITQVVVPP